MTNKQKGQTAETFSTDFLIGTQGARKYLLVKLPASVLTKISYAAVRGRDDEEGAVQRVLNSARINSIKQFTVSGGDYPNAIVVNWVASNNRLKRRGGKLTFLLAEQCAQIIDGQHRVAGIKAAIEEDSDIGKLELPVVLYENLSTQECADIFLSINTEQKPVARSLVFDLYGIASEQIVDPAAVRARDLAMFLNSEDSSPYLDEIKMPGAKTRKGGIPLSSAVTGIKPLVDDQGAFDQIGIHELELQKQVVLNWFLALQSKYSDSWYDTSNVFMYAAGFTAAMDFLKLKLIPYCNIEKSFEFSVIKDAIVLTKSNLIKQDEVKGQGGSGAAKIIYDRLVKSFKPEKSKIKTQFKV